MNKLVIVLALLLVSPAAFAGNGGGCPAFNAGMLDATMLVAELWQIEPPEGFAGDSPKEGTIYCQWFGDLPGAGIAGMFFVRVEDGTAEVTGFGPIGPQTIRFPTLRTAVFNLSIDQQHACRAQVLKSFVWQQYCKPLME
jgi:hypothetical protein